MSFFFSMRVFPPIADVYARKPTESAATLAHKN